MVIIGLGAPDFKFRTRLTPLAFLVLQFADSRLWDLSTSNSYKNLFLYLSIYPTVSGEPWLIQIFVLRMVLNEQHVKDEFSELVLRFLELAL